MATYKALTVQKAIWTGILDLQDKMVAATTQGDDGFSFDNDGRTILVIQDTDAGDTFTLVGKADEYGRHETDAALAITVGAGKTVLLGPFPKSLWDQAGNVVAGKFGTPAATTKIVAVQIP